jgi:hypothetical protein
MATLKEMQDAYFENLDKLTIKFIQDTNDVVYATGVLSWVKNQVMNRHTQLKVEAIVKRLNDD